MTDILFQYLTYAWIGLACFTFISLFFVIVPFGRHTSSSWGPMINARLSWIIMELPSPLFMSYFFFSGSSSPNMVTLTFWAVWTLHYFNRAFVYPLRQRDHGKKMPIMIMGSALFFNIINGSINGYFLGNYGDLYTSAWFGSVQFVVGISLFVLGMSINVQSDNILLSLRKPGETGYKIPKGGLFSYISCPNLFGEIIEWLGFAIMVWALPAASFAIWTFANLAPRAIAHHQWYASKFEDYPKKRKALLPFIW